jgi:hypothetical protein
MYRLACLVFVVLLSFAGRMSGQTFPRDLRVDVTMNQVGFTPGASKRCGPSETGYLAPCHCDDAVRLDNGKHQETTGGWHDASDLRKWVGATIHGMIGLAQVYELTATIDPAAGGSGSKITIVGNKDDRVIQTKPLDWVLGCNPFYAGTVVGIGHNQPPQFVNGGEFHPPTPMLPGAVMNGLGGTMDDQPSIGDGDYHVSEYWTPMVSYTMWLMAVLQQS